MVKYYFVLFGIQIKTVVALQVEKSTGERQLESPAPHNGLMVG